MSLDQLFDPIFLLPFVNGLLLAALLPLLGAWIRLREEWLAALGLAQVAAAGVVLGAIFMEPVGLVALAAAALAAAAKAVLGRAAGNDAYAVMILLGWATSLIAAAFAAHGDELSHALIQGQIYFTGSVHLQGIGLLFVVSLALLPWLSPRLLLGRFFPDHFRANRSNPHHDVVFDVLVALTLALSATAIGVMAAFALVFVPPWVAFRFAHGWRRTIAWSVGFGLAAYLAAFVLAIRFDQPFGPVLVLALMLLAPLRALARA